MGLTPLAMRAVALEKFPDRRWLARLPRRNAQLVESMSEGVHFYSPMTEQLTGSHTISAEQEK
jgi:hypothetical protein